MVTHGAPFGNSQTIRGSTCSRVRNVGRRVVTELIIPRHADLMSKPVRRWTLDSRCLRPKSRDLSIHCI